MVRESIPHRPSEVVNGRCFFDATSFSFSFSMAITSSNRSMKVVREWEQVIQMLEVSCKDGDVLRLFQGDVCGRCAAGVLLEM